GRRTRGGNARGNSSLHGRTAQGSRPVLVARDSDVRAAAPPRRPAGRRRTEVLAGADDADRIRRELDRGGAVRGGSRGGADSASPSGRARGREVARRPE